jgi:2-polyprenyl-3-methyl-5-hydroxy-6-metoxy-1,4-benzoquinol methylase
MMQMEPVTPAVLPELLSRIIETSPMQAGFFERAVPTLRPEECAELERYLAYCLAHGTPLDELAASYELIVKDTLREQIYFRKHGHYRHASYAEVSGSVYLNASYMRRYMHGLALTSFLWPNHAALRRYFLSQLPRTPTGRYLEVGPGHGFYFLSALRSGAFSECLGVDLSPTSVELTRSLVGSGAFGSFDGWRVDEADFTRDAVGGPFDWVVMGEVLEHVEQPQAFLSRARSLCAPGGRVFITTCANSPATDHIFLFESAAHVEAVAEAAGLRVVDSLVLSYAGASLEESVAKKLPVNLALVLTP